MISVLRDLSKVKEHVMHRPTLRKILINMFWLSSDKVIRLGVGLFVTSWVARYLGPEQFGLWNFAIALTALFGAVAHVGLDSIVVREIVKAQERTGEILGTAFLLRLVGAAVAFALSVIGALVTGNRDMAVLLLVALVAGGFFFQAFFVIDYYYQAHIMSKYTIWAQNLSFLIISSVKIILILFHMPLVTFVIASLFEVIMSSVFLIFVFRRYPPIFTWRFSFKLASSLLKDSWPMMLSGVAIMIYMRIDQVMIREMLGDRELGVYSAAVRISEIWYFIPVAIANSVYPKIIESKMNSEELYYRRLQNYFTVMTWLGILVGAFTTIAGRPIIKMLFGDAYLQSVPVLQIHIWSGVFVCMGVASSGWFLAENLQNLSFLRTLLGAVLNVLLNLVLIPKLGVIGAALSTLICQASVGFLFDVLSQKTRVLFEMKLKTFVPYALWFRSSISSKDEF